MKISRAYCEGEDGANGPIARWRATDDVAPIARCPTRKRLAALRRAAGACRVAGRSRCARRFSRRADAAADRRSHVARCRGGAGGGGGQANALDRHRAGRPVGRRLATGMGRGRRGGRAVPRGIGDQAADRCRGDEAGRAGRARSRRAGDALSARFPPAKSVRRADHPAPVDDALQRAGARAAARALFRCRRQGAKRYRRQPQPDDIGRAARHDHQIFQRRDRGGRRGDRARDAHAL